MNMVILRLLKYLFFVISLLSFYFSGKYLYLTYYGGQLINKQTQIIIPHNQVLEEEVNESNVFEQANDNLQSKQIDETDGNISKVETLDVEKKKIFDMIEEFFLTNPQFIKKVIQEHTKNTSITTN
jgi:hypothetical protein